MLNFVLLFVTILLNASVCLICGHSLEVEIPSISCPQYFEYIDLNGTLIGKLTLPNVFVGITNVEAHFSQWDAVESHFYGSLTIYPEDEIDTNSAIKFRVDFPQIDVLPKLTRIMVNGEVICSAPGYPSPAISFKMQHIFRTKIHAIGTPFTNEIRKLSKSIQIQSNIININNRKKTAFNDYLKSTCGRLTADSKFDAYIYGNEVLKPGEYPWLAAIFNKQPLNFICSGALISAKTILTAAHCFDEPDLAAKQISVYLGHFNSTEPTGNGCLLREVESFVINPEYKSVSNVMPDADIALVLLLEPVSFTKLIRPICL